jgi:glutathione S-transferase
MKLFFSPGACSLAPHIVLREVGIPFALEKVDTAKHVTAAGGDYYVINAKGQVPLLELDDGTRLTEGPVIAQFIADRAGNVTLMPSAGSVARYRVMEWQNYITSELHKSFTPLFNPDFDTAAKSLHAGLLRKKYEWVDSRLANSKYLTGEDFTAADAYLFTVTGWAKHVNLNLSDLPNLQRFLASVAARPAVREAMKAEGLLA